MLLRTHIRQAARTAVLAIALGISALLFSGSLSGDALAANCGEQKRGARCDTPTFGGPGGGAFRAECPEGFHMYSIEAQAGSYVDRIWGRCFAPGQNKVETQRFGGTGGKYFPADCPNFGDIYAIRLSVAREGFVRSIQVFCNGHVNPQCTGYGGDGKCVDVRGDTSKYYACPDGMVVVGLKGKHGSLVDRLGLICGPKPGAAPAPPPQAETRPAPAPRPAPPPPAPPPPSKNYTGMWAVELFPGGKFTFQLTQQGQSITGQMVSADPRQNGTLQGSLEADGRVSFSYVQPQLNTGGQGRFWLNESVNSLAGRFSVNGNAAVRMLEGKRR